MMHISHLKRKMFAFWDFYKYINKYMHTDRVRKNNKTLNKWSNEAGLRQQWCEKPLTSIPFTDP